MTYQLDGKVPEHTSHNSVRSGSNARRPGHDLLRKSLALAIFHQHVGGDEYLGTAKHWASTNFNRIRLYKLLEEHAPECIQWAKDKHPEWANHKKGWEWRVGDCYWNRVYYMFIQQSTRQWSSGSTEHPKYYFPSMQDTFWDRYWEVRKAMGLPRRLS